MKATSTFTGTAAGVAIALCVINTLIVLLFLARIWLQDWVPWKR